MVLVELKNMDEKRKLMMAKKRLIGTKIYVDDDLTVEERGVQWRIRERAAEERKKGKVVKVGYRKVMIGNEWLVWGENGLEKQGKKGKN
jgi:hypothetical protein